MRNGIKRDLIIYCDRASGAASELAKRLCCRRIYSSSTRRIIRTDGSLIVNYGTGHPPNWPEGNKSISINDSSRVKDSISKVVSYEKFREAGIPCLGFTLDIVRATGWHDTGKNVLCRRDRLSSGRGIVFSKDAGGVQQADFYTEYFPKTHEYRVHVFGTWKRGVQGEAQDVFQGRVIDITQKKKHLLDGSSNEGDRSLHQRVVRSLDNGWVHAHEGLHLPLGARQKIEEAAIGAVGALGLDFGAVDILVRYSTKDPNNLQALAVAEVNTAPGLGNEATIKAYENAINELYEGTKTDRYVPIRRRVRKLVPVTFVSRKGNKITRMRYRRVYE